MKKVLTLAVAALMASGVTAAGMSVTAASAYAASSDVQVGEKAPMFETKDFEGKNFDLASRKDHWTVLYFYPKAGTPGCTKQACGFRDNIKKIQVLGAEVYGMSTDTVENQAKFHKDQHLNFMLLADPEGKVASLYGTRISAINIAKRWTFIIDPSLVVRAVEHDVDPAMDAAKVAKIISDLQKNP